jgi:catechol 2,3-dioxygenase-like lactoylglutathione lyase family enzyme
MHTESDPTAPAVHPTPDVSPGSDHHGDEGSRLRLATAVMFVTDLARSVEFYQDLLGWDVTVEDDNVALLASPEGFQMYLHRRGPRAQHPLGQIGIQYLIWTARDEAELHRCLRVLQRTSSHDVTTTNDGFTVVEGRDPDRIPILVTYPGPADAPRREIMRRLYVW